MTSRYANTLSRSTDLVHSARTTNKAPDMTSRFADMRSVLVQSARGSTKAPSDKALAMSRNTISSQLMNVYYQQKEIALSTFDTWNHEQKTNFLLSLLPRASYRQLVHVVNWFQDNIPIWSLDFTTVLPRFLSLYIFSFLDTQSLTRASSVCWSWKFIAEQDVLWQSRCLKIGWQLPFIPSENEYGAWKKYYAKNYRQLHSLGLPTPDLGDKNPPFLNQFDSSQSTQAPIIVKSGPSIPKLHLSQDFTPPYDDAIGLTTSRSDDLWISGVPEPTTLVFKDRKKLLSQVGLNITPGSLSEALTVENVMEQRLLRLTSQDWKPSSDTPLSDVRKVMMCYSEKERLPAVQLYASTNAAPFPISYPTWLGLSVPACTNPRIVLISDKVPSAELLALSVAWSSVEAIVYDFQGSTPDSLLKKLSTQLGHRMAKSIGIVPSQSDSCLQNGFPLTNNCYVTPSSLESASDQARQFFCGLAAHLLPRACGGDGHVDLFAPLLMHAEGAQLLVQLNAVTGIIFHCPQTVRSDFEYLFGNSDWIVTKESVGLLERPLNGKNSTMSLSKRSGTLRNSMNTLSEKIPPKLYFEENRLAFWLKTCKLLHRSVSKIRRDLARTFENRTESCLLDRLVGQVAFDEFEGTEFSFIMSIWPEVSQALMAAAASSNLNSSIGHFEDDDDQLEWRMAQKQYPTIAVAAKLLEQAGYCVKEKLRPLTEERASQSLKQTALQNKNTQTMSMVLQSTALTVSPGSNEENQSNKGVAAETVANNGAKLTASEESAEEQTMSVTAPVTFQAGVDGDADSLLLGEKGEAVVFGDAVGEGDSNGSSGVESYAKSDTSSQDEYPFDSSIGIRPQTFENGATLPVKLDVTWTIERVRLQTEKINHDKKKHASSRMVYSVLFTEIDRRLIAARDLFECESRFNKILSGIQTNFVYPLNQAVFQERAILSTNNIKLLFSDLMALLDTSNDFLEALETRLENWVDVDGQVADVLLTFVCGRWNIFLSYMNNYPVVLETLDRCCDEQRLFRSFVARNERTLAIRMLSLAEVFVQPFDQLAAYRSHFKRILAHTDPAHLDIPGLREARKLMSQYCSLVAERAGNHSKMHNRPLDSSSAWSNELFSPSLTTDDIASLSSYGPVHKFEATSDLSLLRDCPFVLDAGSASERRFVCRQDVTLMRPASGKQIPFALQLFEVVDEIGFFLFSDCLVVAKRRSLHKPYVREAEVAFYFSNCVPTRDIVQKDLPDTKYISCAVEYRSKQNRWIVVFPGQQSKDRFMAVVTPYTISQLAPSPRIPIHHN